MIYKDFKNIEINNYFGVSRVGEDTLILAKHAAKISAKTVLDVGTGTGFIAIYLAVLGKDVEAIDISSSGVHAAQQNAKVNNINLPTYESDLFNKVSRKFDLIIFNAPIGTVGNGFLIRFLELVKFSLPKSTWLFKLLMPIFGSQRKNLLTRFIKQAIEHLNPNGTILLYVTTSEKELLDLYSHSFIEEKEKIIAVVKNPVL